MGPEAEVVLPINLKNEIKRMLKETLKRYED